MKQQKKLLKDAIREGRRQNKAARRERHEHARAELVERRIDGLNEAAKELREGKSCEQTTVVDHRQGSSGAETA